MDREGTRSRRLLGRMISLALAAVLIGAVLPRIADFSEVVDALESLGNGELIAIGCLAAWNLLSTLFPMMIALPGLRARHAFVASQLATAVTNTVPGGSALAVGITYAVFSSFGHTGAAIGRAAVVTGLWNTMLIFALPAVALLLLAVEGDAGPAVVSAAVFGAVLLAAAIGLVGLALSAERFARGAGKVAGRVASRAAGWFGRGPFPDWPERFARFRRDGVRLLARRWPALTLTTMVSHLSMFAVLLASLRFVGVAGTAVTIGEALGAFAVIRLATAVPVTPGGLGIVEVGLTAALVLAGGPQGPVVAAVLLYRGLTFLLQVPLGLVSYGVWARLARRRGAQSAGTGGAD